MADQAIEINQEFSKIFQTLPWPQLRELNLQAVWGAGEYMKNIISSLPPSLLSIHLDENYLGPEHFQILFKRCPNLKLLISTNAPIVSSLFTEVKLPSKLEILTLRDARIRAQDIAKIIFPHTLKKIDLSNNPLGDIGLIELGKKLAEMTQLESLILSNAQNIQSKSLRALFFPNNKPAPWLKGLKNLSLNSMHLNTEQLALIVTYMPLLTHLVIDDNLLGDSAVESIGKISNIKTLSISKNFLTRSGLGTLFALPNLQKLESLIITNTLGFNGKDLAKNMPKNLKILNYKDNSLTSTESTMIFQHLPRSLFVLSTRGNQTDILSIKELMDNIPPYLNYLYINGNFNDVNLLEDLIRTLPQTMQTFGLYRAMLTDISNAPSRLDYPSLYPHGLEFLNFEYIHWSDSSLKNFLQFLPESIDRLSTWSSPASASTLMTLNYNADNMRIRYPEPEVEIKTPIDSNIFTNKTIFLNPYLKYPCAFDSIMFFHFLTQTPLAPQIYGLIEEPLPANYKLPPNIMQISHKVLDLFGKGVDDHFLKILTSLRPNKVERFTLSGASITHKGLIPLLNVISKDAYSIDIPNTNLTFEGVDSVIDALPKNLRTLNISGLKIGEAGYEKFREWKRKQEEKLGYAVELTE